MANIEQVLQLIDQKEAIAFLRELINHNTVNPPGNEKILADLIHERTQKLGLISYLEDVEEGRSNIISSIKNEGDKHLVFSGHLDTVPIGDVSWKTDPFEGRIIGDQLFGRGASDMKSGVAAMILAIEYLLKAGVKVGGTVTFVGTIGEEMNAIGAKNVMQGESLKNATAIVVGEPSKNQILFAHKGALWLKIEFKGKAAHGSMPEKGTNAILAANEFIHEFKTYKLPGSDHLDLGKATVNIGTISGGTSTNMVPDSCSLTIDIRTVAGHDHQEIVNEIRLLLEPLCNRERVSYAISILNDLPAVATPKDDPFIVQSITTANELFGFKHEPKTVNYYTDASVFAQYLNVPILIYGPGEPEMAHKVNEYVFIKDYINSIKFYIALTMKYLGGSD